jgi:uncharacterized protein
MKDLQAAYGRYAVVTGASSGIGAEFARQLAAAGLNGILVARRKDRLEDLAAQLTREYGTTNEVVALDLLAEGAVDRLSERVSDLDVGIVVANAGSWVAGRLVDHPLGAELDVLNLHAAVLLKLAHGFGRTFAQRRRGAIIMVSSLIAGNGVPYQANYAAAKAYVLSLGQALNYEMKEDGVDVLVVSPGVTKTEGVESGGGIDFDRLGGGSAMAPSKVVSTALNKLGKRAHVIPGVANNVVDLVVRDLLPRRLAVRMYGSFVRRALAGAAPGAVSRSVKPAERVDHR